VPLTGRAPGLRQGVNDLAKRPNCQVRGAAAALSTEADDAHRMTWCCLTKAVHPRDK
jgi:hypothetical protein